MAIIALSPDGEHFGSCDVCLAVMRSNDGKCEVSLFTFQYSLAPAFSFGELKAETS